MTNLEAGHKAPSFEAICDGNTHIKLADFKGKKVVLFFYPKDNTSGCTKEACGFRDLEKEFADKNTVILGISKDSVKSHNNFKEKFDLPFLLISDESTKICQDYGVWKEKSMYGRKYMGIERTTFLIDEKEHHRFAFEIE